MNTEIVILSHLLFNEDFARKVIPHVKPEYFERKANKVVFELLEAFVSKYNTFPTKEALLIDLTNKGGVSEQLFNESKETIIDIKAEAETNLDWLVTNCEEWCQERSLHNAVIQAIRIIDEKKKTNNSGNMLVGSLPKLMSDALSVSFDQSIGHDFLDQSEARYDFYHRKEKRISCALDSFNNITGGGWPEKSLNLVTSVTGGGKTRFMCNEAANVLRNGGNALYITLEMAEERIAERIDANLLDIPMNELRTTAPEIYKGKMAALKNKTHGKLVIKEYPTAGANANHFRFLLNELKLKRKFVPDIIFIDYINICCSSRLKMGNSVGSYGYIKSIAEELRGLAVEFKPPILTGTQINRSGFSNSDVDMEHTSESIGLPATVDFMFALIGTEELDQMSQILVKQLKTRYGDPTLQRRFVIGVDKPKMRLYDVENPTDGLMNERSIMDQTNFGQRLRDETKSFEEKTKGFVFK
jgi:Replicative DNA helicase